MLTERRRKVVETLVQEKLTAVDFTALKATHQRPKDTEKPEGRQVLDAPAYTAALEALLIDDEAITDADLDELAMARADAVRSAVTGSGQITANRVPVATASTADLNDSGWIPMQLELSSGSRDRVSDPPASNQPGP